LLEAYGAVDQHQKAAVNFVNKWKEQAQLWHKQQVLLLLSGGIAPAPVGEATGGGRDLALQPASATPPPSITPQSPSSPRPAWTAFISVCCKLLGGRAAFYSFERYKGCRSHQNNWLSVRRVEKKMVRCNILEFFWVRADLLQSTLAATPKPID